MKKSKTITFMDTPDADVKFYGKDLKMIVANPGRFIVPSYFKDFIQNIIDMPVYDHDTWLCSFPKTGSTWAGEMVWLIANDLKYEEAKEKLFKRVAMVELSGINNHISAQHYEGSSSIDYVKNMSQPRFVKSHLPWELLPTDMMDNNDQLKAKIIYTMRDPKDTCVSLFNFHTSIHDYDLSFDIFCESFLQGKNAFGSMWNHIVEFWKRRKDPNLMILRYEHMKRDLPDTIRNIAKFLNKHMSEDQVAVLCHHLSFDKMKINDAVSLGPVFKQIEGEIFGENSDDKFFRKGIIGDWKNYMPKEVADKFDEKTRDCYGEDWKFE